MIGWAACRWDGDWSVDPQWARVPSGGDSGGDDNFDSGDAGDPVTVDDCRAWWSDPGADITGSGMNFQDNPGYIGPPPLGHLRWATSWPTGTGTTIRRRSPWHSPSTCPHW